LVGLCAGERLITMTRSGEDGKVTKSEIRCREKKERMNRGRMDTSAT